MSITRLPPSSIEQESTSYWGIFRNSYDEFIRKNSGRSPSHILVNPVDFADNMINANDQIDVYTIGANYVFKDCRIIRSYDIDEKEIIFI